MTENVLNAKGLIKQLSERFTGAIRAEVLLFRDIFNKKYSDNQNPRNAAAGIIRRKDHKGSEDLSLICYDAYNSDDMVVFTNEIHKIKWLKSQGFDIVKTKTVKSPQEVINIRIFFKDQIKK